MLVIPTHQRRFVGGSAVLLYRYNAAGQRIYKNVNGTVEHYVMNGSEPIAVLNADGTLRYWITSFGRAEKSGSSYIAYYYLKDHLGSTRVVMKEDGTRVEGYDFEPWGGIMQSLDLIILFRFAPSVGGRNKIPPPRVVHVITIRALGGGWRWIRWRRNTPHGVRITTR